MVGEFPLWFLIFVPLVTVITLVGTWCHSQRYKLATKRTEEQIEKHGVENPRYCCTTCSRLFETKYQGQYHSCVGTPHPQKLE